MASQVDGFAVHWPGGAGSIPDTRTASIQLLDGELAFHTNPEPAGRGWSDIAYQYAIDLSGRVWELRGVDRRSAANGDTDVNERFGAVTCLLGPKDTPSPQMLQAVRDFRTRIWLPRFPRAVAVVCHSDIRPDPTDCPGDRLRAHVRAGTFTTTHPLAEDDDMPSADEIRQIVKDVLTNTVVTGKDADPQLASLTLPGLVLRGARRAGTAAVAAVAAANRALPAADVDESALAAHLAPLLGEMLPAALQSFSPAQLQQIAAAVADEEARRLAGVTPQA